MAVFSMPKKKTFIQINSGTLTSIVHNIYIEGTPIDPYNLKNYLFYFITDKPQ